MLNLKKFFIKKNENKKQNYIHIYVNIYAIGEFNFNIIIFNDKYLNVYTFLYEYIIL